jgi:hypothetical protein
MTYGQHGLSPGAKKQSPQPLDLLSTSNKWLDIP